MLTGGQDLVYDIDTTVTQQGLLCLGVATDSHHSTPYIRAILHPDGAVHRVACQPLDTASMWRLLAGPDRAGWSRSVRLWASPTRLALHQGLSRAPI